MLLAFYKHHKEWFTLFSSAFVGTLLGIGITFGISAHAEQQKKEEVAQKILILSLNEIGTMLQNMERDIPQITYMDSVLTELGSYKKDELEDVPDELVDNFIAQLINVSLTENSDMAEKIFSNNIEILEAFDDLSVIADISHLFNGIHDVCIWKNKIEKIRTYLAEELQKQGNILDTDYQDIRRHLFAIPDFYTQVLLFRIYAQTLPTLVEVHMKSYQDITRSLGITEEDFKKTRSNRNTQKEINQHFSLY